MISGAERGEWEEVVLTADLGHEPDVMLRAPDVSDLIYPDLKRVLMNTTKKNVRLSVQYPLPVYTGELRRAAKRVIEEDGIRKDLRVLARINEGSGEVEVVYPLPEEPPAGPFYVHPE
jgi:hypothetical protein